MIDQTQLLTRREVEVLALAATGMSNGQIGKLLILSEQTIKSHLARIGQKLNTHDRTASVVAAIARGALRVSASPELGVCVVQGDDLGDAPDQTPARDFELQRLRDSLAFERARSRRMAAGLNPVRHNVLVSGVGQRVG